MREETVKLYTLTELTPEIQEKVIEKYSYINVENDWWDSTIDMMREKIVEMCGIDIGQKIYFDLDRANTIAFRDIRVSDKKKLVAYLIAEMKKEDGKKYRELSLKSRRTISDILYDDLEISFSNNKEDTYMETTRFQPDGLLSDIFDGFATLSNIHDFLFRDNIRHAVLDALKGELDYAQSEAAIRETIECNEFEFKEGGSRW